MQHKKSQMSGVNFINLAISPNKNTVMGGGETLLGQIQSGLDEFGLLLDMLSNSEGDDSLEGEEEKKGQQSIVPPAEEDSVLDSFQKSSVSVILETNVFQNIRDVDSSSLLDGLNEIQTSEINSKNSLNAVQEPEGDLHQVSIYSDANIASEELKKITHFDNKNSSIEGVYAKNKIGHNSPESVRKELAQQITKLDTTEEKSLTNYEENPELEVIEVVREGDDKSLNLENAFALKASPIISSNSPLASATPDYYNNLNLELIPKETKLNQNEKNQVLFEVETNQSDKSKESFSGLGGSFKNDESQTEYNLEYRDSYSEEKSEFSNSQTDISDSKKVDSEVLQFKDALSRLESKDFKIEQRAEKPAQNLGEDNLNKISLSLKSVLKSSKKEVIKIELNPKDLGTVQIEFEKDKSTGISKVTFTTEKFSTFDLFSKSNQEIQKVINDSGIKVDDSSLKFEMQNNSERRESNNKYFADSDFTQTGEIKVKEYVNYSLTLPNDEINIIA